MDIFEFDDYKLFVNKWIQTQKGNSNYSRLAEYLNVSSTMISQVFKGDKDLSLELANEACEYLGLTEKQTEYFFLLVEHSRAGSHKLKQRLRKRIHEAQLQSQKLSQKVAHDRQLSEVERSMFYSSWMYSGIRNLVATEKYSEIGEISERLKLPRDQVQAVVEFLLSHQLIKLERGRYAVALKKTHLGSDSPFIVSHHRNWRIKAMEKMQDQPEKNMFYSGPMSLSEQAAHKIRSQIGNFIKGIVEQVGESESEVVRCFNVDWFEY